MITAVMVAAAIVGPAAMSVIDPAHLGADSPQLAAWRLHVRLCGRVCRHCRAAREGDNR